MSFKEDLNKAQKDMNRAFGIISRDDLSLQDKTTFDAVKRRLSDEVSIEDYIASLNKNIDENVGKMLHLEDYGQELAMGGDFIASTTLERIRKTEPEYQQAKRDAEEKEKAYQDNDKHYRELTEADAKAKENIKNKTDSLGKDLEAANKKAEEKEAVRVKKLEDEKRALSEKREKDIENNEKLMNAITKCERDIEAAHKEGVDDEIMLEALNNTLKARKQALEDNHKEIESLATRIEAIKTEIEDTHELNEAYQKNGEKYLKSKSEIDKLVEKQNKTEAEILKADKQHEPLKQAMKEAQDKAKVLGDSYASDREKLRKYASEMLKEEMTKLSSDLKDARDYVRIQARLENKELDKRPQNILKGADTLNDVYKSYKKSHWAITRFLFRRIPGTQVYEDYRSFDELRTTYMNYSGVKREDIDAYLDSDANERTGALKTATDAVAEAARTEQADKSVTRIEISADEIEGPEKSADKERMPARENVAEKTDDLSLE